MRRLIPLKLQRSALLIFISLSFLYHVQLWLNHFPPLYFQSRPMVEGELRVLVLSLLGWMSIIVGYQGTDLDFTVVHKFS